MIKRHISAIQLDTTKGFQIFQLSRFLAMLIISVVLVKSLMPQNDIGLFEYSIFALGLFSFIWNMGIKNALLNFYARSQEKSGVFLTSMIILFAWGFIAAIVFSLYSLLMSPDLFRGMFWLIFMNLLLYGVSSMAEYIFLLKTWNKHLVFYGISIHVLQVALLSAGAFYFQNYEAVLLAFTFWIIVKTIISIYYLLKVDYSSLHKTRLYEFIFYTIPFMIYVFIGVGMEYIDGLLVKRFFPIDDFPIFRYGARELPISTLLIGAMITSLIPLYISNSDDTSEIIKKKVKGLMNLLYPVSIVLILISPLLYRYFYNDMYVESAKIFNIYLLILVSRIVVPQIILIAKEKMRALIFIGIIELILNVGISLFLLREYGLSGIAYGTVIAYFLQKIIMVIYLKSKFKIQVSSFLPIPLYLAWSILLITVFYLSNAL